METVEHVALVSLVTQLLGKQSILSAADVDKLLAARARHIAGLREREAVPATESTGDEIAEAKSGRLR
jgi:hypothetical protein